MSKVIKGRECKFVTFLPELKDKYSGEVHRRDTHVIKEIIHYEDGTIEPNLNIVYDFKRPLCIRFFRVK